MNLNKVLLSLLLLNCSSIYSHSYDELSKQEYPARICMVDYPDFVFDNDDNILFFIFCTLSFTQQTMDICTDCFDMEVMMQSSHIVRDDEEVFHFTYWNEPILFALKLDKISKLITLDFITSEVIALDEINSYCDFFVLNKS